MPKFNCQLILTLFSLVSFLILPAFAANYDGSSLKKSHQKHVFTPLKNQVGNSAYQYWDMFKGPEGYLWIATNLGILKYDGYRFYRLGLNGERVHSVELDGHDNIWLGTYGGAQQYDHQSDQFSVFSHDEQSAKSIPAGSVNKVFRSHEGLLWLGMLEHFVLYDKAAESFTPFSPWPKSANQDTSEMNAKNVGITDIYQQNKDIYWLGTYHNGLIRFNKTQNDARIIRTFRQDAVFVKRIKKVVQLDDYNLLLATRDGLIRFNIKNETFQRFPQQNPITESITALIKTQSGDFWAGGKQLYYINKGQNVVRYQQAKDFGIVEKHSMVGSLYEDEEQGVYVMFNGKGIYHTNSHVTKVKIINDVHGVNEQVLSLLKTGELTFSVSYAQALFKATLAEGVIEYRQIKQANGDSFKMVAAMHKGIGGTLWVADASQISAINADGKVQHFRLPDAEVAANKVVLSLIQDYRGDVWLTLNHRGLLRLRPSTGRFEEVNPLKEQQLQSWSRIWLKAAPDRESLTFVKSTIGYGVYDIVNERVNHVYTTKELKFAYEKKHPLKVADVWMVNDAHHENVILTSSNKNFFARLDLDGSSFTKMSPNNIDGIVGIVSDSQDKSVYWLASTLGQLYRWDATNNEHQVYGKLEGIPASGIAFEQGIMLADDTILWSSQDGLVVINTRQNNPNLYKPSVVLNRFDLNHVEQKNGQSTVLDSPVSRMSRLNLDHTQNSLLFGFSSSSFAAPQKNRYQYRLTGLHDDWIEAETEHRKARYTNLKSGNYTFEVKASNNDGVFSDVRQVEIDIAPSVWESRWAMVVYLICVLSTFYFLFRKKIGERKLLEQKVSLRTKELVQSKDTVEQLMLDRQHLVENIYHQTRTPLQIMLGNISTLEETNTGAGDFCERQRSAIFKLTHLTDQVLDVSKVTESPQSIINISSILKQLAVSYRDIAKNQDIALSWQIADDLFTCCSPMSLEKAFDNVLSNAVKYTNEGEVCFTAKHSEKDIVISCIDTGIGIPSKDLESIGKRYSRASNVEGRLGSGIGLSMITDVITAHKGQFDIQSKVNEGTQVTIRLKAEVAITPVDDEKKRQAQQILQTLNHSICMDDNGEKSLILIAEDNIELAGYLNSVLEKQYQIINTLSGEEALVKARELVPDLILSDVMMGTLDGFELVQNIRSCDICCHIPVILLTAKSDDYSREYGYQVGASDFINKPFKENDLQNRINNQLQLIRASVQKTSQPAGDDGQNLAIDAVNDDRLVMGFLSFVAENYSQSELQTKDICEQLHISIRQLERKVKHFLHVSPKQFLNDFRLSRAKECIDRGETIGNIYYQCGFSSHTYFTKKFKDKYTITPSEYKKGTKQSK